MAVLPRIASSRPLSVAADHRPIAGARNVATANGGAVRSLSATDTAAGDAPGFPFNPAVGDREDRRAAPTLFKQFSATTSAVTTALNDQRAAASDNDSRQQREQGGSQAVRAVSLYEETSQYLAEGRPTRGGSLNLKF